MNTARKIILFVALAVFLGAGGYLGYDYYVSTHEQQALDELASVVDRATAPNEASKDVLGDGSTSASDNEPDGDADEAMPQKVPEEAAVPTQPPTLEVVQKGALGEPPSQGTDAMAALIHSFIQENPEFAALPMDTVELDVEPDATNPVDASGDVQAQADALATQAPQSASTADESGVSKGQQLILEQLGENKGSTAQQATNKSVQVHISAPEGEAADLQAQLDVAAAKLQAYIKGHTINADLKTGRIDFTVRENKPILPQYAELYAQNNDMVGWIRIEGTKINFPLMQTPNDSEFYLQRGFDKQYARSGLPFVDARCNLNYPDANILVYGHNMKGGKMFAVLKEYEERDFWKWHKIVKLDLLRETREYQIIGAFRFKPLETDEDGFRYYDFMNISGLTQYERFVKQLKRLEMYNTGLQPKWGDQLLILTTCSYHAENGKFVVVARRTK